MSKPPPSKTRLRISLAVLSSVAVLFAFASLGAVVQLSGSRGPDGQSRSSDVIELIFLLILTAIFTFLAVQAEHMLRRGRRPDKAETRWDRRLAGWGNEHNPRSWYAVLAFGGAMVVLFVVLAIVGVSQAHTSHFVQTHGTRVSASVTKVTNTHDCGSSDCWYLATINASFAPAVAGETHTTVHAQEKFRLKRGDQFTALVDPRDPSYAELPGDPYYGSWSWGGAVVGAGFILLVFMPLCLLFLRRARREAAEISGSGSSLSNGEIA